MAKTMACLQAFPSSLLPRAVSRPNSLPRLSFPTQTVNKSSLPRVKSLCVITANMGGLDNQICM